MELEIDDNQIRFSRTKSLHAGMLIKDEFSETEDARHQKRQRDSSCDVGNRRARNGRFLLPGSYFADGMTLLLLPLPKQSAFPPSIPHPSSHHPSILLCWHKPILIYKRNPSDPDQLFPLNINNIFIIFFNFRIFHVPYI